MSRPKLLEQLVKLESLAEAGKLKRFLFRPIHYLFAIGYRKIVYPLFKSPFPTTANTFWNQKIHLLLPAATDIYLLGGKSHFSEIRLARFLIHQLNKNDTFFDIGAHYGYFSILASALVDNGGKVISFEPSPTTFNILNKNLSQLSNAMAYNQAAAKEDGNIDFYIFSNLYSEFNTFLPEQFNNEKWFDIGNAEIKKVAVVKLTNFIKENNFHPSIIKIDVEGAEDKVIAGLLPYIESHSPTIVMEYLSAKRGNISHKNAADMLYKNQYKAFQILKCGEISLIKEGMDDYLIQSGTDSDNIVFVKE